MATKVRASGAKPPTKLANTQPRGSPRRKIPINKEDNPFSLPSSVDVFAIKEQEKAAKKLEREKQKKLKVHQKTIGSVKGTRRSRLLRDDDEDGSTSSKSATMGSRKPKGARNAQIDQLAVTTRDRRVDKEHLAEFIEKKREMFLVQYSLDIKRDEMQKLEDKANQEKTKLDQAEKWLEADATKFDAFLKENDRNSVEAIQRAEDLTKLKLSKVAEAKTLKEEIMALSSELSNQEDILERYQSYGKFLYDLAPKEWQNQHAHASGERLLEENEDASLYFKAPTQLLQIFSQLEEQNLSLIQNGQDTEDAVQDLEERISRDQKSIREESKLLEDQIAELQASIAEETEKAEQFKLQCEYFADTGADEQEKEQQELNQKVEEVYLACIGENEASISALQMLTNIENELESLYEKIEKMSPEMVEQAEKAKEKERRLRAREEKLAAQKAQQEERTRRAMERARAAPRKQVGKKLTFRSAPPKKKKVVNKKKGHTEEEEEMRYFFT